MINDPNLKRRLQKPSRGRHWPLASGHSAVTQSTLSYSLQDTIRGMTHVFLELAIVSEVKASKIVVRFR